MADKAIRNGLLSVRPKKMKIGHPENHLEIVRLSPEDETYDIRVVSPALTARATVSLLRHADQCFAKYFKLLALKRSGGDGNIAFNAAKGGFDLTAVHDKVGHVVIKVELSPVAREWKIETTILVELEQLERIAEEAHGHLRLGSA